MSKSQEQPRTERLGGEDLSFWWLDSPMQPTTMAMLMVLDRAPTESALRAAFDRARRAVPRLSQRVVEAPLDLTLPHWEDDPTFDLEYHVRRHKLAKGADLDELFHEIVPAYETPFDRSRPLWEARVYEGLGASKRAAVFFKLHHALADGVGGNAIFAALTDGERSPKRGRTASAGKKAGAWPEPASWGSQVLDALRDRIELDIGRAQSLANTVVDTVQHPDNLSRALQMVSSIVETAQFDSGSPLKAAGGRSRKLIGMELPFAEVHALKAKLGGCMIDAILTIMALAMRKWHKAHRLEDVQELMTLVPVNLRNRDEWTDGVAVGNVTTGILLPLPIGGRKGPRALHREICSRMEEKKADPVSTAAPALAEVMTALPRQLLTWMSEASYGSIDFIVTNVPGILIPRYLAGAEIEAAYPFAPIAARSPASIALYGYRDSLFIGIDADAGLMPDTDTFQAMIRDSFLELRAAATTAKKKSARKTS